MNGMMGDVSLRALLVVVTAASIASFAGVVGGPMWSLIIFSGLALVCIAGMRPRLLAPCLVVGGLLFIRPNIWGEAYTPVGVGLFALAAVTCLIQDRGSLKIASREFYPIRSGILWLAAAYLWLLLRVAFQGYGSEGTIWAGFAFTVGSVLCAAAVVADRERRLVVAKLFVALVLVCCISYLVTAGVWFAFGAGAGKVSEIRVGTWPGEQPVYFPLTTTVGVQSVAGIPLPRFVGFGREPGWMALYGAVAYMLLPLIGWRKRILRLIVMAGVLGTISTAGFGVLVICVALNFMLNGKARTGFEAFLRVALGLTLIGVAAWLAFNAPVLGFDAKGGQNAISLSERSAATNAGLWALENSPFSGGIAAQRVGAVNLVAAVAAYGVPFSIAILLAVLTPLFRHPRKRLYLPSASAIGITLATSQPALDSAWVFCLVALCAAIAMHPVEAPVKVPRPIYRSLPPSYQRRFGAMESSRISS